MPEALIERVVAVDWSGDRSAAGQRRKIWAAVWTAAAASGRGASLRLESGRTRAELVDRMLQLARETPRMVVGIDCCFSFPHWFLAEHGCSTVYQFWQNVAGGKGEQWLHRECADSRFWGVTGSARTGKRPAEFSGEGLRRMMRITDWENKIAVKLEGGDPDRAAKMRGITAKSPFQIGGSGSVGTGSLRAMPVLQQLRAGGFRVWPFESARLRGPHPRPLLVEMYSRLLTGPVVKSNAKARRQYLLSRKKSDAVYANLSAGIVAKASGSEDAFDALVSCLEMVHWADRFPDLKATRNPTLRVEGITWRPAVM